MEKAISKVRETPTTLRLYNEQERFAKAHCCSCAHYVYNYVYSIDTQNRLAIINYFPITILIKGASGNEVFITWRISCSVHAQRQLVLGLLYLFIPCCHCIGLVNGVVYICNIHMKCRCG